MASFYVKVREELALDFCSLLCFAAVSILNIVVKKSIREISMQDCCQEFYLMKHKLLKNLLQNLIFHRIAQYDSWSHPPSGFLSINNCSNLKWAKVIWYLFNTYHPDCLLCLKGLKIKLLMKLYAKLCKFCERSLHVNSSTKIAHKVCFFC